MTFSVFYSGNITIQNGDPQTSFATCANGKQYTFAQLGINATAYNTYTTSLWPQDNSLITQACGASQGTTYTLGMQSHKESNNAFGDASLIFIIGAVIIEICRAALSYLFTGRLK
jgi:hypothetical protein